MLNKRRNAAVAGVTIGMILLLVGLVMFIVAISLFSKVKRFQPIPQSYNRVYITGIVLFFIGVLITSLSMIPFVFIISPISTSTAYRIAQQKDNVTTLVPEGRGIPLPLHY